MPGVSLIKTGNRSSLLRESCSLDTSTEIGKTGALLDAGVLCTVVVVAPVVVLVVVVAVAEETRGMEGLVRAVTPGRPMKVRMKLSARVRVPSRKSRASSSSSSSQPDLVRYARRFSDRLLRKNSNVETPSGVVNMLEISDNRVASV